MDFFVGREKYLVNLKKLFNKRSASLVVIKGRRRIGKSRLAEEFSRAFPKAYLFSGLVPEEDTTVLDQKNEFIRQLREYRIPSSGSEDWGDLFRELAEYSETGRVLVVLDEITWMGSLDPNFLGKLKIAWDKYFKKNPKLILILSGSNSAWIEKNILSKTGFFGRISYRIHLGELPLHQCAEFWGKHKDHISAYEKLKILSVTGGVPRYLEEIDLKMTAEENIFQLCYQAEGVLFNEFDEIFHDLFQKLSERYKKTILCVADGKTTTDEIAKALGRERGGDLSGQLAELVQNGFISRDYSWHLKNGQQSKISKYRLSDNYLRFYLKYILPFKHQIENDEMNTLPSGWDSIVGLQFENLVVNNRKYLHKLLNINPSEIIMSNPYLQTQTQVSQKCQIDYLVQTKFNTLYVCEIKFHKSEINSHIIQEMQAKIEKLVIPKGFSIRPVLIHVNGVSDSVVAQQYFSNIVDFGSFF